MQGLKITTENGQEIQAGATALSFTLTLSPDDRRPGEGLVMTRTLVGYVTEGAVVEQRTWMEDERPVTPGEKMTVEVVEFGEPDEALTETIDLVAEEEVLSNEPARRLAETMNEWGDRVLELTEEEAGSLRAGRWTTTQLVGHLVDSAQVNLERFLRARHTDDLEFPGYPTDAWVEANGYATSNHSSLALLWHELNTRIQAVMDRTPQEALTRLRNRHTLDRIAFRTVSVDTPCTLEYLMIDYVDHLEHHLRALFSAQA